MEYQQTLWEYPLGRYCIIGGVAGLVVLIFIIVFIVLCCRQSSGSGQRRPSRQRSSRRSREDSWKKPRSYDRPKHRHSSHSDDYRHSGHSDDRRHSPHSSDHRHSSHSDDRRHSRRRPHSDDYGRDRYNHQQRNRNIDFNRRSYDERDFGHRNDTYMAYPESEDTLDSQIDEIYQGTAPDLTRGLDHRYSMVKKAHKAVKVVNAFGRVAEFFSD